jgi:hypothetical protein
MFTVGFDFLDLLIGVVVKQFDLLFLVLAVFLRLGVFKLDEL